MSSCATQTFTGIAEAEFNSLIQKTTASGIAISGNAGQASKDGITVRWLFDPARQSLELPCMNTPFFLSCGAVNSKLHDMVESCLGGGDSAAVTGSNRFYCCSPLYTIVLRALTFIANPSEIDRGRTRRD
jgi:hypothetical protein